MRPSALRVLIVDDDGLMLRMLAPRLARLDDPAVEAVQTALTPQDALLLLEAAPPGPLVVISDFNLKAPLNGLQLLEEVRKRRPDALRVLMSGYSAEQLGDVGAEGAADAFVEKSLHLDETMGPLHALLRRRFGGT